MHTFTRRLFITSLLSLLLAPLLIPGFIAGIIAVIAVMCGLTTLIIAHFRSGSS